MITCHMEKCKLTKTELPQVRLLFFTHDLQYISNNYFQRHFGFDIYYTEKISKSC